MIDRTFSEEAVAEIKKYSQAMQSCEATAYNLWHRKLTVDFEPNPSSSDVIMWSLELGFGIPSESASESKRKAIEFMSFFGNP